jgi:hypothetical protein
MYYLLALFLPPLASHKTGRGHFAPCLACYIVAWMLPLLMRSVLLGLLTLPLSGLLMLLSVGFAFLDVRAFYREASVLLIAEAIRRTQTPPSPPEPPAAALPASYDPIRDTWRID